MNNFLAGLSVGALSTGMMSAYFTRQYLKERDIVMKELANSKDTSSQGGQE